MNAITTDWKGAIEAARTIVARLPKEESIDSILMCPDTPPLLRSAIRIALAEQRRAAAKKAAAKPRKRKPRGTSNPKRHRR